MPYTNFFIISFKDRRRNCSLYHADRIFKKVKIVVRFSAKRQGKGSGMGAAPRSACTLCIIRRCRRHIAHKYRFKFADIDAHFKCC